MKKSTLGKCLLLLVLAWLFASCSVAVAQQAPALASYKQVPIEQWQQLKQNQQELLLKLSEAKLQATTLKNQSEELTMRLTLVEEELTQCQQELTTLNTNLQNASDWQERARQSLTELTNQIEAERKKQQAIERKHRLQKIAWFIGGYILGKEVGKAVD